ncbi:MAG: ABC transporter permease [Defluviitaleaceae bacterium]|nr:ABC transporter permease [Defluviitaleaceae bacterium]
MLKYILKRFALTIVTLFFIILVTFSLMHAVPGGPFSPERPLPPAVVAALEERYNLNAPLHQQFFGYMGGLFRFDLGPSIQFTGRTVNELIASGAPHSLRLGLVTIVFVLLAAVPMGIVAALKNNKWQDMLLMALATMGVTIPSFVLATVMIYVFSFRLDLTPTFGLYTWSSYILPVIALGGFSLSFLARLMRSSLLEVMGQDYIRTARAKGISEVRVIVKHGLRNALIPMITVLGPTIAALMVGSFVVERIFAIPGMGSHFVTGIANRDYTTIMGMNIFFATFLLVMVFVVDLFYCLIDPRIKFE